MSDEELEPLDPSLASLLEAERGRAAPPAEIERLWGRLIAVPPPLGGGHHAGAGATIAGHAAKGGAGWLASHAVGVVAATFVAGGLAGAGIHAVIEKPLPPRVVYVERPVAPSAPSAPAPSPIVGVPPDPTPAPSLGLAARAAPAPLASSLAAERTLIDAGRSALGSGDAAKALALFDEHARRYPRGQLGEEREALSIQALVVLGRYDDARARAARFRQVNPHSLFLAAVEASLASIP
jgi:hypothetical protein